MRCARLVTILLPVLAAATPHWKPSQYQVSHWGPTEGLPEEAATSLAQDQDGFLWISTLNGLARFDGQTIRVYRPPPGSESISFAFNSVVFDPAARALWTTSLNGTIARIENGRFASHPGWRMKGIVPAVSFDDKPLFITGDGLMVPVDHGVQPAPWEPPSLRGQISAVYRSEFNIWLGLRDGRLLRGTLASPSSFQTVASATGPILSIEGDPRTGAVWAIGGNALLEVRHDGSRTQPVTRPGCLRRSRDGTLWVGAENGIYRLMPKGDLEPFASPAIPVDRVNSILEDADGNLWLAFGTSGLYRVSKPLFSNWGVLEGVTSPFVRAVHETRAGAILFALADGRVQRHRRGRWDWADPSLHKFPIVRFEEDAAGIVWGLSRVQLWRLRPGDESFLPIPSPPGTGEMRTILVPPKGGHLQVAAENGLWAVSPSGEWQARPVANWPAAPDLNTHLQYGPDGRGWYCTRAGIYRLEDGSARRMPIQWANPSDYFPFACYADADGDFWVGMNGGGLLRVRGDKLAYFHSLPSDPAYFTFGIGEDLEGNMWLALRSGLMRIRKKDLNAYLDAGAQRPHPSVPASDLWTAQHGLRSANFGRTVATLGAPRPAARLWFVNLRGAVAIDTRDVDRQYAAPVPYLVRVRQGTRAVAVEHGHIPLRFSEETLRIDLQTVVLSSRDAVRFRYRLHGLSPIWHAPARGGAAEFTNLPPGSYQFVAEVADSNGKWSPRALTLAITVQPRYYQSWWFGMLVVLSLLGGVLWFVRMRTLALQRDKLTLETKVQDRTRDLEAALDAARQATQAKSDFLANMSHEIRTPMNAVVGMTSLLLDMEQSAEAREFVTTIRHSSESLLTILNDILDLSKIESGKLELEDRPFLLHPCVEEACSLWATAAFSKGIELVCDIDPAVPQAIHGDVTRVRQILVNLISNAVKFTARGEVIVSAAAVEGELVISVADTGPGIPPSRMHRLFQSFSQLDTSTTRQFGGTGLGLTISKRLAELMGGRISVESTEGVGSRFALHLAARLAQSPIPPEAPMPLAGRRLLVVDRSLPVRRVLLTRLQHFGARVTAIGAFAELQSPAETFDAALIERPLAHSSPLPGSVPVIQLTQGAATLPPGVLHLAKPIRARTLTIALERLFTGRAAVADSQSKEFDHDLGRRAPLRILLAEDNPVNQKVALRLLERMGYHAHVASNGAEVLSAVAAVQYDLVLMDLQMPVMDGLEATREIVRRWPAWERPTVVGLSANAMQADKQRALDAGMDDFLTKPISVAALQALLLSVSQSSATAGKT